MYSSNSLLPLKALVIWTFQYFIQQCAGQCDTSQYLTYQGSGACYKIFTDFLNRDEAERKCQSIGYNLLDITDSTEHQFIRNTFLTAGGFDRIWLKPKEDLSQYFVWVTDNEEIRSFQDNTQYCYKDTTRSFLGFPVAAVNTQNECRSACEKQGLTYQYYGMRFYADNGVECFCGNSFDQSAQQWNCDRNCPGDSNQKCGSNYDTQTGMYPGIVIKPLSPPIDSNGTVPSYVGWESSEPDNAGGYEMCISMEGRFDTSFDWRDSKCSDRNFYVCQYSQGQSACQNNFRTYSPQTGKCYRIFNNERLDFYTAKFRCFNDGGSLLKIEDENVDDEIKRALKAFPRNTFINQGDVWIGATRSKWLTTNNQETRYYSFAQGQPGMFNRNCMVLSRNAGGRDSYNMEDFNCNQVGVYTACKLQVGPPPPPPATRPPFINTPAPTAPPTLPPATPSTVAPTLAPVPIRTQPPVIRTNPPLNPATPPVTQPVTRNPIRTPAPGSAFTTNVNRLPVQTTFNILPTQDMRTPRDPNVINPNPQKSTDSRKITNGVIIAIVIVGTAILVGLVKLTVSCCQGRNG